MNSMYLRAEDIVEELGASTGYAYKMIRTLNAELKEKGFYTITGRVSRKYFEERLYGLEKQE